MPTRHEFVAYGKTEEEICAELGADGLLYQTVDDLISVAKDLNPSIKEFDTSCFTGECSANLMLSTIDPHGFDGRNAQHLNPQEMLRSSPFRRGADDFSDLHCGEQQYFHFDTLCMHHSLSCFECGPHLAPQRFRSALINAPRYPEYETCRVDGCFFRIRRQVRD